MSGDFWTAAGVIVPATVAILGAYWFLTKTAVKLGVSEALLVISKEYATKDALREHIEQGHPHT